VPVLSFLLQHGKCRACGKKISWQYPAVEIATASLFLLILNSQFSIFNAAYLAAVASALIVIFVFDLKHYIIPDKIIYPLTGLVFIYRIFEFLKFNNWNLIENWKLEIENLATLSESLSAAILASSFFAAIYFASRGKWMGFGDAKLAFFMGLFLGWPNILVALFIAFILGGIMGVFLIALRKKSLKSQVPFGPFLVSGTFVAMFWGDQIVRWYLGLIM
jgi:leader peptidase (prepilin peptidase)/N-methyltransferase